MKLIDGKGQLGTLFVNNSHLTENIDCTLYHTWNFSDKSENTQLNEYNKFIDYVKQNPNERIIFISTKCAKTNNYTYYKQKAESYLSNNSENYLIIRLPNLIGKGICERFKTDKSIIPYGNIELLSVSDAYDSIIYYINNSKNGLCEMPGEIISAKLTKELVLFGGACS